MFRNVFRLFIVFIVALFVRQAMVIIMRAFSQMAGGTVNPSPAPRQQRSGGELKKDPVCGTFVAVASSIQANVEGEVIHFCSTACRDKYQVARA